MTLIGDLFLLIGDYGLNEITDRYHANDLALLDDCPKGGRETATQTRRCDIIEFIR